MLTESTAYGDLMLWEEAQGVNERGVIQVKCGCTAVRNGRFCGAVPGAGEWREKMVSNRNGGQKKAWYCPSCDCRQRPFASGKILVVDILDTDKNKWSTIITNPPPSPIMSALTLLKYDSYKLLIETWGDTARQHLPKPAPIKEKTKSPYNDKMFRFEDFENLDLWSQIDWWVLYGLAVGWSPEHTKKCQLRTARKLWQRCSVTKQTKPQKQV